MSYKAYSGVQSVLSDTTLLAAIEPGACTAGQLIAVKDVEWLEGRAGTTISRKFTTVYMWDPNVTAHSLLEDLSGESNVTFPRIALSWWWNVAYAELNPIPSFDEDTHLGSYAHLFIRPSNITSPTSPGRWVAVHYATFLLHAGFTAWDQYESGAIVPKETVTFDLGTADKKVRHLFLSPNSIWVGDQHKISITSGGDLRFRKRKKGKIPAGLGGVLEVDVLASLDALTSGSSSGHGDSMSGYELTLEEWEKVAIAQSADTGIVADLFEDSDFEDATTDINTMRSDTEINALIQSNVGNFFDTGTGLLLEAATPADIRNVNVAAADLSGYTPTIDLDAHISSHADVATGAAVGGYFTGGVLNTSNAHADLKNVNVVGADLSGYTPTSGLEAIIGSHGDVAASATVSGYFSGGALDAAHYTDTQPKSDADINTLIGSHGDVAASATVSGYFSGGALGAAHYTDTQPKSDADINTLIGGHGSVLRGSDVADLFVTDEKTGRVVLNNIHYTDTQPRSTSSINSLITGHSDVSAGKAAGLKFDTAGNLKMSAQTSAMFGNDGKLTSSYFPVGLATTSDLNNYATTDAMNTGLSAKASSTSVANLQSGLVRAGTLAAEDIGLSTYYSAPTIIDLGGL